MSCHVLAKMGQYIVDFTGNSIGTPILIYALQQQIVSISKTICCKACNKKKLFCSLNDNEHFLFKVCQKQVG